jgi:hypothetical protein
MKEIAPAKCNSTLTKLEIKQDDVFEVFRDFRAAALKKRRKLLRQRNLHEKM